MSYCPVAVGDEYYTQLDMDYDNRWKGVLLIFAFFGAPPLLHSFPHAHCADVLFLGEVSEAKPDLEKAISRGGGVMKPSQRMPLPRLRRPNQGEGNEWRRYVSLKFVRPCLTVNLGYSKLAQGFTNHPSVKDVSEKVELFGGAGTKFNIPSLPSVVVRYPRSGAIKIRITAKDFKLQASRLEICPRRGLLLTPL